MADEIVRQQASSEHWAHVKSEYENRPKTAGVTLHVRAARDLGFEKDIGDPPLGDVLDGQPHPVVCATAAEPVERLFTLLFESATVPMVVVSDAEGKTYGVTNASLLAVAGPGGTAGRATPIRVALGDSEDPCPVIDDPGTVTFSRVARLLARVKVAAVGSPGAITRVVTQSDILRAAFATGARLNESLPNCEALGITVEEAIQRRAFVCAPLLTVDAGARAIDAVRLLHAHHVRAVAITDATGKPFATFSAGDVKGIRPDAFVALARTSVLDWIRARQPGGVIPPQIATDTHCTVASCLTLMLTRNVHRVWLTRKAGDKIDGVLTMTDVLLIASKAK